MIEPAFAARRLQQERLGGAVAVAARLKDALTMNDVDTKLTRKLPKELNQRALREEAVTVAAADPEKSR